MKKDFIFAPILVLVGAALFLLDYTGMPVHIAVSVVGALALAVYTAATKKSWKIPALEIAMRAMYGLALITGIVVMNASVVAVAVVHRIFAVIFLVGLVALFVHKLIVSKNAQ